MKEESITLATGSNSAFIIFTLFGDYLIPFSDGMAWTQELIYLLGLLGMPERTARTTLTRMKNRGWFEVERDGRKSRYILTERGHAVLEQGRQRIFEPATIEWDEQWQVVVYSLPEEMRPQRDEFRKKLIWFGFGNLASGTWIASHDRTAELIEIADQLDIRDYVSLFNSKLVGMMTNQEIVTRCWDLRDLGAQYEQFVACWQPRLDHFFARTAISDNSVSPQERFRESLWLTADFQPFPRIDPNLPVALLPHGWSGYTARQLFRHYRQHLRLGLPDFFANLDDYMR